MANAQQQNFLDIAGLSDVLAGAENELGNGANGIGDDGYVSSTARAAATPKIGFINKLLKHLTQPTLARPQTHVRKVLDLFSSDHTANMINVNLVGSDGSDIMQQALMVFAEQLKASGHFKVTITAKPMTLDLVNANEKQIVKAVKSARLWMMKKKTELLILCKPSANGLCFGFQFISLTAGGVADLLCIPPGLAVFLPARLDAGLEKILQSVALAATGVSRSGQRKSVLGPVLKNMLAETDGASAQLPSSISDLEKSQTLLCLSLALLSEHYRLGAVAGLAVRAHKYVEQAVTLIDEAENALVWADAQGIKAQALLAKGGAEKDRYRAVKNSLRAALKCFEMETHPQKWAGLYNQLGQVFYQIGFDEGDTEQLRQALACFQNVLKVYSRAKNPHVWAEAMMSLARTAQVFGEHSRSLEAMDMAVRAYHSVLEMRHPEQQPMLWAATQNNLGSALFMLGKQSKSMARLDAAAAAFQSALTIYDTRGAVRQAYVTAKNLKHVERMLNHDEPLVPAPPELPWEDENWFDDEPLSTDNEIQSSSVISREQPRRHETNV